MHVVVLLDSATIHRYCIRNDTNETTSANLTLMKLCRAGIWLLNFRFKFDEMSSIPDAGHVFLKM